MSGLDALDQFIENVQSLARINEEVAREAAPAVQEVARSTARAGTDPEGNAWKPTKAGTPPLEGAADHVFALPRGARVDVVLRDWYVYHQQGTSTLPARRIIPDASAPMPDRMRDAVAKTAERVFNRKMSR